MHRQFARAIVLCMLSASWAAAQPAATAPSDRRAAPQYLPAMAPAGEDLSKILAVEPDIIRQAGATQTQSTPDRAGYHETGSDWWFGADYLLWWFKNAGTPPLVTAGTPASAGILGRNGTTILFGGRGIDVEDHQGIRLSAGVMFDEEQLVGMEGSYFFLAKRGTHYSASSSGSPVLARPFFNVNTGAQDSELVAAPGLLSGGVRVALDSQLQGAETNFLCVLDDDCGRRVTVLLGYRYAQLDEGLRVAESLLLPAGAVAGGSALGVTDSFTAHSHFYGGQVGLRGEWWHRCAFVRVEGKLAVGLSHESVNIDGNTQTASPGGSVTSRRGGLLALPTNIGRFHRDEFAVLPEGGVKLGYQLTGALALTLGYSFLYWSEVVRPGNQIDVNLNPAQLPTTAGPGSLLGPARPAAILHGTDFWAQGLNVGLELRY